MAVALAVALGDVSPLDLDSELTRLVPMKTRLRKNSCEYDGTTYKDEDEWDYYTSEKTQLPYYGFKLKCEQGRVSVQGCYESELFVAKGTRKNSKVYDGYDMLCADSGFSYEATADSNFCHGYKVGEIFDQGFHRYQCTKSGLIVIACLDLDGNTHPVEGVYDVLGAYRMKCLETNRGLTVEAIACIDEDKKLIDIGQEVQSGWYRRSCQERPDQSGLPSSLVATDRKPRRER